eukprot:scaffold53136_cov42-Phaeocystis_antarctica.AAC.3
MQKTPSPPEAADLEQPCATQRLPPPCVMQKGVPGYRGWGLRAGAGARVRMQKGVPELGADFAQPSAWHLVRG